MKDRLVRDIGASGMEVTAMTFHSFVWKMLRDYKHYLKLPEYRIIDTGDDETLMRLLRKGYMDSCHMSKAEAREFPSVKKIQTAVSNSINKQISFEEAVSEMGDETLANYLPECMALVHVYQEEKQKNNYLNFDDMMVVFVDLLQSNFDFVIRLSQQFTHIMCDEYQDTNALQECILTEMTRMNQNLCVVGDDNQSIYRFRAVDIENILTFEERYPDCSVVPLTYNYRSTQEILDVSNAMMEHAKEGIPKQLIGQSHGDRPLYVEKQDDRAAARYIVEQVVKRYRNGIPLSQQAVLVRKAMGSSYVEQELMTRKIPFTKRGGQKFLDMKNVKLALNYLRLAVNSKDELAWRCVLQEYPGIGFATIEKIVAAVQVADIDVMYHPELYNIGKSMAVKTNLSDFRAFYERMMKGLPIADKLDVIHVHYKYVLDRQLKRTTSDKEIDSLTSRMNQLDEQIQVLKDMASHSRTVSGFLDSLTLEMQNEKETDDKLVISTIHSAKGLEWDTVYFLHPVESVFIGWKDDPAEIEEERRVMYVCLTRAKKHMELVQAMNMMLNGSYQQSEMSSFLNYRKVIQTLDFV